ncbi:hypothetical protein F5X99DRAFT_170475 [Biscogniauxia marginata]|nr:hypothetical protein F5X99DRAFT_170475 [Biscogniauxia marginata]
MRPLSQSRNISVPSWVENPSLLAPDAKPIVIDIVRFINRGAPRYDTWWKGAMSTRDRATRVVDQLGRAAGAPWVACCCADQYQANMSLIVHSHVVRERARYISTDDHLAQYDTRHNVSRISDCLYCQQVRYRDATIVTIAAILVRCERRCQEEPSSSWSLLEGLRNLAVCGWWWKKTDYQNWMLRPALLAKDLEPVAVKTIRDLNGGWLGVPEVKEWATPLTTAQRVDLIQECLARQLNDLIAAASAQKQIAKMLGLIFAPHQVREIEPRLLEALQRKGEHHCYTEYRLTEAFWKEVRSSLLRLMWECEELSNEPSR